MEKYYKIIIVNWSNNIIGAFTDMEAFDKATIKTKNYDIVEGYWTKKHIMKDYNLDDFNLIKHD
jgi:hypothetical protein